MSTIIEKACARFGMARDNEEILSSAISYLRASRVVSA